jgi:hypothetical protein
VSETAVDYDAMTKAELTAEAESRGMTIEAGATKQDIIDALTADEQGTSSPSLEVTEPDQGDLEVDPETPSEPDVADVEPGSGAGESGPLILAGYWVTLGSGGNVPEGAEGKIAAVVSSPWKSAPIGVPDQPIRGYTFDEEEKFLVRLRDETNALLELEQSDFVKTGETRVDVDRA